MFVRTSQALALLLLAACSTSEPASPWSSLANGNLDNMPSMMAPPSALDLSHTPLVPGDRATLSVDGLPDRTRVYFVLEHPSGSSVCPAPMGGACFDLNNGIIVLGNERVQNGTADLTFRVPPTVPLEFPARFQAVAVLNGVPTLSNVSASSVGDVCGDASCDGGEDCFSCAGDCACDTDTDETGDTGCNDGDGDLVCDSEDLCPADPLDGCDPDTDTVDTVDPVDPGDPGDPGGGDDGDCPVVCADACAFATAQAWAEAQASACALADAGAMANGCFATATAQVCAGAYASAFAEAHAEACATACSDGSGSYTYYSEFNAGSEAGSNAWFAAFFAAGCL